jgi:hypothetical protein
MARVAEQGSPGKPRVRIIGIYPVEIDKLILLENARLEFGEGRFYLNDILELSDDEFAERFEGIYLFEVEIDEPDALFDLGLFTQEELGKNRDYWQVAYDEKYLNRDGSSVQPKPGTGEKIRVAFFFHSPHFEQPLLTQYGPVQLPTPTDMPERLRKLFRYVPPC